MNTQKQGGIIIHHYQRLKDLREDLDLNQTEIAKKLGMKQQQYSEYERGLREIPFYRAVQLAEFHKVSLDYIAGLTNDKRGIGHTNSKYNITQQNNKKAIININESEE